MVGLGKPLRGQITEFLVSQSYSFEGLRLLAIGETMLDKFSLVDDQAHYQVQPVHTDVIRRYLSRTAVDF